MNGNAAHDAGFVVGSLIATVIFLAVPIAIGIFVARRINKNRDYGSTVRWPIIVGTVISGFILLSQCAGNRANAHSFEIKHG